MDLALKDFRYNCVEAEKTTTKNQDTSSLKSTETTIDNERKYDINDTTNNDKENSVQSRGGTSSQLTSLKKTPANAENSIKPLGKYQLVSIMNHSGTSRGGHYRASIRGDRKDNF